MLADVGMVKTYSKSAHVNDLGFAWTDPSCCMDRLAPSWHGPTLLLVPTVFCQVVLPCRYTLHHPYICPCFWTKHFYTPLFLFFLWNANYSWASQLLRLVYFVHQNIAHNKSMHFNHAIMSQSNHALSSSVMNIIYSPTHSTHTHILNFEVGVCPSWHVNLLMDYREHYILPCAPNKEE